MLPLSVENYLLLGKEKPLGGRRRNGMLRQRSCCSLLSGRVGVWALEPQMGIAQTRLRLDYMMGAGTPSFWQTNSFTARRSSRHYMNVSTHDTLGHMQSKEADEGTSSKKLDNQASHNVSKAKRSYSSATPRIVSREGPEGVRITITPEEKQIFRLLLDVCKANSLPTNIRVAGGWVRDKVSLIIFFLLFIYLL